MLPVNALEWDVFCEEPPDKESGSVALGIGILWEEEA